ncbi:MAG: DUF433 domain-containing protein [Pseudomonadota bacterium]
MKQDLITQDKNILGGIPVFARTRVPVRALWEYLAQGNSIEIFLDDFPTVSREQTILMLQNAERSLLNANTH